MNQSILPRTKLLAAAIAAVMLVACGQKESQTLGQNVDSAVAKAEQRANEAKTDVKQEAAELKANGEAATDKVATKVEDATITASVKAELARDNELSALEINVDTSNGNVSLSGPAPNRAARDRATQLASSVKGVTNVDNRLVVPS